MDEISLLMLFLAVIILLFLINFKNIAASFHLARCGVINYMKAKKQSARLKKDSQNINLYISRLQELRNAEICENSIKRTVHFCKLIETMVEQKQIQDCWDAVNEKLHILEEIQDIEYKILAIAETYKNIGNIDKCKYYLGLIQSENIPIDLAAVEDEYKKQHSLRIKEKNAIQFLIGFSSLAILGFGIIFTMFYIDTAPYKQLRSEIENQTLTREMCYSNTQQNGVSYYDCLHSKKGYQLLASILTDWHQNNDIKKAMWLLCVQPNCIDGITICASDSFIDWIVDYAKENGTIETNSNNTTYTVDGYEITINPMFDYPIGHKFSINNGQNNAYIRNRNSLYEKYVPTIQ